MKVQYYFLLFILCSMVHFNELSFSRRFISSKVVTKEELKTEILARMDRVDEIRTMKKLANELGIKHVYLFGGSASAWAHYVYWDMDREAGVGSYDESRFDYDYTSIFRANQDMDIVVDVDENNMHLVQVFERRLQDKFKHFQGNKSAWEVRPLRFNYKTKDKILDNPDFLNQNSDSHSTGLISVTGEDRIGIRDFKDWDNSNNHFLDDVYKRELHYYRDYSMHRQTKRYQAGLNPEVFSAIRYLIKAFQYELSMDEESVKELQEVFENFDPSKDLITSYAKTWVENNAKKLYQNAIDIEFAYDQLEKLEIREKLIGVTYNVDTVDSMAWWLNKMPLLTSPLGDSSRGKTARELGIEIVAHATSNFTAYESITKSHSGLSNVFISRQGIKGEAAIYGNGFYTQIGKQGARRTGLTIRFFLHPDAVNGIDFEYVSGNTVLVKNKAAIQVIPESLEIAPVDYFDQLINEKIYFDFSDNGVREKVFRRIKIKMSNLTKLELDEIAKMVTTHIARNGAKSFDYVMEQWFSIKESQNYPDILELLKLKSRLRRKLVKEVYGKNYWPEQVEHLKFLIDQKIYNKDIVEHVLSQSEWKDHPELIERIIDVGGADRELAIFVFSQSHRKNQDKLLDKLIENKRVSSEIVRFVLSQSHWTHRDDLVELLLDRGDNDRAIAQYILSQEHWKHKEIWVERLINKGNIDFPLIQFVIGQSHFKHKDEWVDHFYKKDVVTHSYLLQSVLNRSYWFHREDILDEMTKNKKLYRHFARNILSNPRFFNREDWLEKIIRSWEYDEVLIKSVFSHDYWVQYPKYIERLIKRKDYDGDIIEYVLSKSIWSEHPHLIKKLIKKDNSLLNQEILIKVLTYPEWQKHSHLIEEIIGFGNLTEFIIKEFLTMPEVDIQEKWLHMLIDQKDMAGGYLTGHILKKSKWRTNSKIVLKLINNEDSIENLIRSILVLPGMEKYPEFVQAILKYNNSYYEEIILSHLLTEPEWGIHADLFIEIIRSNRVNEDLITKVLNKDHWQNNASFLKLSDGKQPTIQNILRVINQSDKECHKLLTQLSQ